MLKRAKDTGKTEEILDLYSRIFGSFESICATFKVRPS
jgi:hypothetical protein